MNILTVYVIGFLVTYLWQLHILRNSNAYSTSDDQAFFSSFIWPIVLPFLIWAYIYIKRDISKIKRKSAKR